MASTPAPSGHEHGVHEHGVYAQDLPDHGVHALGDEPGDRAQAPIRWPHPDRFTLALIGAWVVGVMVALFVPALIVAPGATSAPTGSVWLAFSTTVVGAAIMLLASVGLWRTTKEAGVVVMGAVPAGACVVGGIILAAGKLAG